ncbi:MAG: DNA primase [Actinobacteria bacterium]|nr:DNA primase [Actinomycetota bacterium]
MGIVDEDIARVRDSTDLVSLVGEQVALKRVGQRYVGLCPFHQEKTPSFGVNAGMGLWKCFGCGKSGDAITWVRDTEHLDFVEAVERLAQRAGIQLRYDDRNQQKDRSRKGRLSEAVGAAIEFYHRLLLEAPEGGGARRYLRSRGFDGDAARQFLLGWAPDGWDGLSRWLQQEKKLSRDDIKDAGLAFVNKANKLQDQFRARLMFPIHDARGEPVGFGGRSLTDDGPKYKNSPESAVYQKSRLLYGLHWAKEAIVARGDVVICEGYTDVMAYALAGHPNAVATCGTALADDHVKLLKNLTRNVTLAYDADSAGQSAAEQWYRWEQTFDLSVRVADLPPGQDPGDLWNQDRPRLEASLEGAKPFMRFRLDRALGSADLTTHEGKGRAAATAAAIVADHPSELVRDQYVMELAGRLQIDVDTLRGEAARAKDRPREQRPTRRDEPPPDDGDAAAPPAPLVIDRRESDLLWWVIHEPELVTDWLDVHLLMDPTIREAYVGLTEAHDFHEALGSVSEPAREVLERLAVEEPSSKDEPQVVAIKLMVSTVREVAEMIAKRLLANDDLLVDEFNRALSELRGAEGLGNWNEAREAVDPLLGLILKERARASATEMVEQGA